MAHALNNYDGPCKNIHGHTYHFSVTVLGFPIQDEACSNNGMVTDFSILKKIVHHLIIDKFDHALVLNHSSPLTFNQQMIHECEKLIILPFQPTCENLLNHFVELLLPEFMSGPKLIAARLDETTNSFAEWYFSDNLL